MRAQHVLLVVGALLFVVAITIVMVGPNLVATTSGPSTPDDEPTATQTPADKPTATQTPDDTASAGNENDPTATEDSGDGEPAGEKESDEKADDESDEKNGRGPPDDGDSPGKGKGHRKGD